MLKKIRELDFFKLFGLIAVYFILSLLTYRVLKTFRHSDDVLFGLGIASVIITALLFLAIFKMRKKR